MNTCPHEAKAAHGLWCPDCLAFCLRSPLAAIAFVLGLLASGCANLPAAAYPLPANDRAAVYSAWVSFGFPECKQSIPYHVYPTGDAERAKWCHRNPPPDSCLNHARVSWMRHEWLIVLQPHDPEGGRRHELVHGLARCVGPDFDPDHLGPWWSPEFKRAAGIP